MLEEKEIIFISATVFVESVYDFKTYISKHHSSCDGSVGIESRLRDERSGFQFPEGVNYLSFLRNAQTGSGILPASCPVGLGCPSIECVAEEA